MCGYNTQRRYTVGSSPVGDYISTTIVCFDTSIIAVIL